MTPEEILYKYHQLLESRMESFKITRTRYHQYEAVKRCWLDLRKLMRDADMEIPVRIRGRNVL